MLVFKATKKPVTIEAIQWTGTNGAAVLDFLRDEIATVNDHHRKVSIPSSEGVMTAGIGDLIIKGVNGEFYPCPYDVFIKTYDISEVKINELSRSTNV